MELALISLGDNKSTVKKLMIVGCLMLYGRPVTKWAFYDQSL